MNNQPDWVQSSFCESSACAQVSVTPRGMVLLRNSNDPSRLVWLTPAEWEAFSLGIKAGEFDNLTRQ